MNQRRMVLTLVVLFVVGIFLIGLGNLLWVNTKVLWLHGSIIDILKPYGALGLVLVMCGVLILAVALGLLFDWHHLLIHNKDE
jgi:uncharacterized membrane protein YidH (DUF202 family)